MLSNVRSLFTPPVFDEDENKTRIASVLNVLLLSLIFGLVLIGFVTRFERLINFGLSLLLTIGTWLIMRRGYIRFASITIVTGISILLAIVVPLTGGVRATTYGGFMVVILLAGLLLGQLASVTVALFASLLGGILIGFESRGIWEIPASTAGDLTYWIVFTVYFLVSAIVLMLALRLIEDGHRKTKIELAERKRAEEELTILYDVAMLTAAADSSKKLFEEISDKIDKHINTDLFSIWLLEESSQVLHAVSRHYHGSVPDWAPPPIPLRTGVIGMVASTGQAMRVPDVTKEPIYLGAYSEARSELCVPMRIGERVIGVINMESNALNAYSKDDERLLSTIASQLAIAIERLHVEDALRESEEYYRSFVEKLPIGVYRVTPGPKGRHLIANAAYLRMFKINSLDELTQQDVSSLYINPSERNDFSDNLLTAGYVERAELHLKRFDGRPIWGAITASVAKGKDGEVFFDCVMEDITERKQAEELLKTSEERLQQAVRAANIGIYDHDHLSDTIYWSPEQRSNYGWEDLEETVVLDKFFSQIHPEDRERIITAVQKAHDPKGEGFFDVEHRIIRRTGEIRWLSTKSRTQFEGTGADRHPFRTVGAVLDITERKQIETEREKIIKELEGRNTELERLAYTISHDLKNPLVTIRGFLGFLENDALSGNIDRLRVDISRIGAAADKMQKLLHDLLDLLQIGHVSNPSVEVPFEFIVHEALALTAGQLTDHRVMVDIEDGLSSVYGDRPRLVEVIQILVENSIKFMGSQPEPRIKIGQRRSKLEDEKNAYFITDNGIGIDPQYHQRIFGLFNKLDLNSEGTGVGLTIVKRIIETHGGKIWVESEGDGKGSTFYFTLPSSSQNQ